MSEDNQNLIFPSGSVALLLPLSSGFCRVPGLGRSFLQAPTAAHLLRADEVTHTLGVFCSVTLGEPSLSIFWSLKC